MKYKLLALDIDGTLLNSKSALTDRTKAAILRATEGGLNVVLATGRRLAKTLPIAKALGLKGLVVVHNGTVIYDPLVEKTIYQQGIDLLLAREILDKLESLAINYVVYTGESAGERVVAPQGSWKEPDDLLTYYLGESAEFLDKVTIKSPPVRISIIDRVAKVDPLYEDLVQNYGHEKMNAMLFGTARNIWRGIEIIPASCNKGAGLSFVADALGLAPEEVVAIGDNVNDIEMITWAGLGIAMENGSQLLKAKAKQIAPSHDQDGVAQIIEKLFF